MRRPLAVVATMLVLLAAPTIAKADAYLPVVLHQGNSAPVGPTATASHTTTAGVTPTGTATATPTATASPTFTAVPGSDPIVDALDGAAVLFSYDADTYLGLVSSSCYAADSIVNAYGTYGSHYSATSVNNQYGIYGSPYSDTSASNQYASHPPVILVPFGSGYAFYAYLTANPYMSPGISSTYMVAYLRTKGGCA